MARKLIIRGLVLQDSEVLMKESPISRGLLAVIGLIAGLRVLSAGLDRHTLPRKDTLLYGSFASSCSGL